VKQSIQVYRHQLAKIQTARVTISILNMQVSNIVKTNLRRDRSNLNFKCDSKINSGPGLYSVASTLQICLRVTKLIIDALSDMSSQTLNKIVLFKIGKSVCR
jgi:hypothetical protein